MAQTVLVTGGTGFVAGWCIVELLRRGYAVRTTVRSLAKEAAVRAAVATEVDAGGRLSFLAADLMDDAGWPAAVAGCDYVLHVASPLVGGDPDTLIAAARDGALRVLAAAVDAGVKRVVLTSSTAATSSGLRGGDSSNDETVWTDLDSGEEINAYRQSKALAERAAWDFMAAHPAIEFTTVLPSAIFGPVLSADTLGSVMIIGRLLGGKMPGTPRIGFSVVDVRDLADAHIRAMESPAAAGERFIACGEFMWMGDIAKALRATMGEAASGVPKRDLPDVAVRLASITDPGLRSLTPTLGRRHAFNSAKAQRVLGWKPRPGAETVVDCARSLISVGAV